MKRLIALMLALIAVMGLAGCAKDAGTNADANVEEMEAVTVAQKLHKDFKLKAKDNPDMTAQEMADALMENEVIEFAPATMPVEEGYLNGFTSEITGFDEGVMFGPVIGSIPFVGYVFKLESEADAADFIATLEENADLRWNICTEADEMAVDSVGNTVFFVMSPTDFAE